LPSRSPIVIQTLRAIENRLDAGIVDAVDRHALAQRVERFLRDLAMRPNAVAAQPAGGGQLQNPRQAPVVGQQDEPFGIDVEAPNGDDARQVLGQIVEDRRAALGVARGRHQAARLVVEEQSRALGRGEGLAVDAHVVARAHIEGGAHELHAVDDDAALGDPALRVAPRAEAGARHRLGDALALAFFAWGRARRVEDAAAGPVARAGLCLIDHGHSCQALRSAWGRRFARQRAMS
jgi:hypothetical protein